MTTNAFDVYTEALKEHGVARNKAAAASICLFKKQIAMDEFEGYVKVFIEAEKTLYRAEYSYRHPDETNAVRRTK
jgi:hypothetical protein